MSEIIRVSVSRRENFTTVSNTVLRDASLSRAAKGLCVELHSHSTEYQVTKAKLLGAATDGRKLLDRCVNELKDAGYLSIEQTRDDAGHLHWVWRITDDPYLSPLTETPLGGSSAETPLGPHAAVGGHLIEKEQESLQDSEKEQDIVEVFDYWASERHRALGLNGTSPRQQKTKKRLSKIRARLKEGYTPADLKRAIDVVLASDFHRENGHTDIELICRDQAHVEQYLSRDAEQRPAGNAGKRLSEDSAARFYR